MCVGCGRKRVGRGGGLFSSREGLCQAVSCASWTPHPLAAYVTSSTPSQRSLWSECTRTHTCHDDRDVTLGSNGRGEMGWVGGSGCGHATIFEYDLKNTTFILSCCIKQEQKQSKKTGKKEVCFLYRMGPLWYYQVKETEEEELLFGFSGNSFV